MTTEQFAETVSSLVRNGCAVFFSSVEFQTGEVSVVVYAAGRLFEGVGDNAVCALEQLIFSPRERGFLTNQMTYLIH